MATETSTRITVKDALVSLLDTNLTGVGCSWGHPGKNVKREAVFVGNIEPHEQQARKLSDVTREERFELQVIVNVLKKASQQTVTTRCDELARTVERVVRDNPQLGLVNPQVHLAEVTSAPIREAVAGDKGRMAECDMRVQVTSRLRRT